MLDDDGFNAYCRRVGFRSQTRSLVSQIRSHDPSRRVGGGGRSVCVRYPSWKMAAAIQAESLHCEFAFVHKCEFDDDVLEFYDQPEPIRLSVSLAGGRSRAVWHIPDYFVLWKDRAGWVECKTEDELVRRAAKSDDRFVFDDAVGWRSLPGERYAEAFDLCYRVWTPREADWTRLRNLRFLETYLRQDVPNIDPASKQLVVREVETHPGIRLSALLETKGIAGTDAVYALIASREIHVDLAAGALAEPDQVPVFLTPVVAEAYKISTSCNAPHLPGSSIPLAMAVGHGVTWNNTCYTVANVAGETVTLLNGQTNLVPISSQALEELVLQGNAVLTAPRDPAQEDSAVLQLLRTASPADLKDALRRNRALTEAPTTGTGDPHVPDRTLRRWRARHRRAELSTGQGFLGLVSRRDQKGNRLGKMGPRTRKAMLKYVELFYEQPLQPTRMWVYRLLVLYCAKEEIPPPTYRTFCRCVKSREGWQQTKARKGPRAAYQKQPFQEQSTDPSPRHGDRPFEITHLDHTLGDIQLVHSETGKDLGRPWITKLTDAYSRRILAVYCTFDPPSYSSCMMALVECVRRHRRLPDSIMTDRGREFGSTYFETLLAYYGVTLKTRPPSSPRHGSVDERVFGTMNTQLIHNLLGNTQAATSVREMSDAVDPKRLAVWTLPEFHKLLCKWCYEAYDTTEHSELGLSPREAFESGMAKFGAREQRLIPYDEQFRFLALPSTATGMAKIDPQRGVKIYYVYYFSPAFRRPGNPGTHVPVRYDPFNCGIAYAYVNGQWETCQSQDYRLLCLYTHRELTYAVNELRAQRRQSHRKYCKVSAKEIARWLESQQAKEQLLQFRRKESEIRQVNRVVFGLELEEPPRSTGGQIGPDGKEWIVSDDPPGDQAADDPTPLEDYV